MGSISKPKLQKCPGLRWHSLNIGDKPSPFKEGYSLGMIPWGSRVPVKAHLDRLPLDPGHTRPDPCTDEHGRLKCVPLNGVSICRTSQQLTSMAQGFFRWVWVQTCSPRTPSVSRNASGSVGMPLKMCTLSARQ